MSPRRPRVSFRVSLFWPRIRRMVMVSPGSYCAMTMWRVRRSGMFLSLMLLMMSPARSPALPAGPPSNTCLILMPERMSDLLGRPVMMPMTGASGLSSSELPPRRPQVSPFSSFFQSCKTPVMPAWLLDERESPIDEWIPTTLPFKSKSGPPLSPPMRVQSVLKK